MPSNPTAHVCSEAPNERNALMRVAGDTRLPKRSLPPSVTRNWLGKKFVIRIRLAIFRIYSDCSQQSGATKLFLAAYELVHMRYISALYKSQLKQLPGVQKAWPGASRTRFGDLVLFPSSNLNHWCAVAVTSKAITGLARRMHGQKSKRSYSHRRGVWVGN
jgi:hypothetical protein